MTINEQFIKVCQDFSHREAMKAKTPTGWDTYTYEDILKSSLSVAGWLKEKGIQKQSKVALILDNSPQWSIVYFGILLVGAVAVPLDPQSTKKDIGVFLADAGAQFIFIEGRMADLFKGEGESRKFITLKTQEPVKHFIPFEEVIASQKTLDVSSLPEVDLDDTASMIYTSGTTSQPKGVELSHKNICSNCKSIQSLQMATSDDVFISILPLFHAYAFMGTLILPLFTGARIVYPYTLKGAELAAIIKETGVSIIVGVPELFYNIHRSITNKLKELPFPKKVILNTLTSLGGCIRSWTGMNFLKSVYRPVHERFGLRLRYLVSGGARLDPDIAKDFYKFGFTILEGYGLTETSPIVCMNPVRRPKYGSVGQVISDVKVKIVNTDTEGIGEVVIYGPNVMKGYYQNPEATAEVVRDGWFYSGDLGFMDKEGYLYLRGRSKEVIVLGSGKNIFPDEIEDAYASARFIRAIGALIPDGEKNLKAVIVPDFEAFKETSEVNIKEKIQWEIENISKELPSYKRLHGFVLSKEDLPRTRLGKIKRHYLPSLYKEVSSEEETQKASVPSEEEISILHGPVGEKVIPFFQKELSLGRSIAATDHLELDLGIDSLGRVELVAGIEKIFQIHLTDHEISQIATVADVIKGIENKLAIKDFGGAAAAPARISWNDILFQEPESALFENIAIKQGFFSRCFSYAFKTIFFLIFKIFFRLKVTGRDNLPGKGPYIICCNHSSYLDPFVVITGLSLKVALQTYFIGTKGIFLHPLVRWSVKAARLIPIDSASELIKAMQISGYVIRNNKVLCVFPEGYRSIDGTLKKFKKGIGILAKELDVPILPAAIEGAYQAWPRPKRFPRPHPIRVAFGKPIDYKEILAQTPHAEGNEYQVIADYLRKEVDKLHQKIVLG